MSLPIPWVERLFEKLTLVYGRDFLDRWKGMSMEDVKADWSRELSGFERNPDAIVYALDNLPPDRPPTVLQFRDMCRRAPPKPVQMLPLKSSPPPPEVREKLKALITNMKMKV